MASDREKEVRLAARSAQEDVRDKAREAHRRLLALRCAPALPPAQEGVRPVSPPARTAEQERVHTEEVLGRLKKVPVPSDLRRIVDLPVVDYGQGFEHAPDLTDRFALPGGKLRLRPVQNAALDALERAGGLLAPVGVGHGKSLICRLMPAVLGSVKPLLLIPAKMRAQTEHDTEFYGRHFDLPDIEIRTYEELSSPKRSSMLRILWPDLVIADEAHHLRNASSTRVKRLRRFLKDRPGVRFAALSGTLTKRSIKDYAHLAMWALKGGSPLPLSYPLLKAMDEILMQSKDGWKRSLPMLMPLIREFGGEVVDGAPEGSPSRTAFRRRLCTTPGVVSTSEQGVAASLVIDGLRPQMPDNIVTMLADCAASWTTPSGEEIGDPMALARLLRQIVCGFHYRWDWSGPPWNGEPDMAWYEARQTWNREVRQVLIRRAKEEFDSPMLVARACSQADADGSVILRGRETDIFDEEVREAGGARIRLPDTLLAAWRGWEEHKDKPSPPTMAVWHSEYLVQDVIRHVDGRTGPVLVWYTHRTFGERVAACSGWPLFADGAKASEALAKLPSARTIVLSAHAHGAGKNLQAWSDQVVTNPISGGATMEQLLGRTHRSGQPEDEVGAAIYLHGPFEDVLEKAIEDATFIQETTGQRQRLLYAAWDGERLPEKEVDKG